MADVQIMAADMVNSIIWNAFPWRWSQVAMTPIPLVDGTQDYTFAPSDYMRLVGARLTLTSATPDVSDELTVVKNLTPDLSKAGFRSGLTLISYNKPLTKLRINQAAAIASGVTVQIDGEYQKQPAKITTIGATLPFPDQYFNVFCDGLLWMYMQLGKDSRAGSAVADGKGRVSYSGKMGEFYDSLMAMREAEDYGAGDTVFPDDPLGVAGRGVAFSGIYGP